MKIDNLIYNLKIGNSLPKNRCKMLTKKQIEILGLFRNDIFVELTFKQIKEQSKQKSNNVLQIALKEFQKDDLIKIKRIGDVSAYSLNLDSPLAISYLNLVNQELVIKKKLPIETLEEIKKRIFSHTEFFILIVFGSYAKDKATERSDLDIAVIVESEETKKEIKPFLETVKRRCVFSIDYHTFTRKEFLNMLHAEYENLGKQIKKTGFVYYGFIPYLNLVKGTQHG